MKKRIALLATGAVLSTTPVGAAQDNIEDVGTGDAVVSMTVKQTPEIVPGQDSWVVVPWTVAETDAREIKVTATGTNGVEVGYPTNTGSYTSLYRDATLSTHEIDFTALRVTVDPTATGQPALHLVLSYVSDTGKHEAEFELPVAVDGDEFEGDGLKIESGKLGQLEPTDDQWFSVDMLALADTNNVELTVTDSGPFSVTYPAVRDHSRPSLGTSISADDKDSAAIRFISDDVDAGTYTVTLEAVYYVGSTKVTTKVERTIIVADDSTDPGDGKDDDEDEDEESEPSTLYDSAVSAGNWTFDPYGTDTATKGNWEIAKSEKASWSGVTTQLAATPSGEPGLVTDGSTADSAGEYDVDFGNTTALSPVISLPEDLPAGLDFSYYFSYLNNSSRDDYLRISIVGEGKTVRVLELRGAGRDHGAAWANKYFDLAAFAGQDIQIFVEAADDKKGSLVEAAVADIVIKTRVEVTGR